MADHRAEQIIQAVVTQLEADGTFSVFRAQVDPLEIDMQDLPATCIYMGPEEPRGESGFETIPFYDARLELYVDVWARDERDNNIETELNEIRKRVHIALMTPSNLGLSFVFNVAPMGADEPELSTADEAVVGRLRTTWLAEYRSSVTDPSA